MSDKKDKPKKKSKNETKTDKKLNDKRKRFSDAGKGDRIRRGMTQDEWGKKWENIFGKKEKPVRSHKSGNSGSES